MKIEDEEYKKLISEIKKQQIKIEKLSMRIEYLVYIFIAFLIHYLNFRAGLKAEIPPFALLDYIFTASGIILLFIFVIVTGSIYLSTDE